MPKLTEQQLQALVKEQCPATSLNTVVNASEQGLGAGMMTGAAVGIPVGAVTAGGPSMGFGVPLGIGAGMVIGSGAGGLVGTIVGGIRGTYNALHGVKQVNRGCVEDIRNKAEELAQLEESLTPHKTPVKPRVESKLQK